MSDRERVHMHGWFPKQCAAALVGKGDEDGEGEDLAGEKDKLL